MHRTIPTILSLATAWGTVAGALADEIDLAAAEAQFRSACGICHVVNPTEGPRQGPPLAGVVGRTAGSVEGFAYSEALAASGIVWTAETLDPWLQDAQGYVPGSVMLYRQPDPEKRRLIVAYLERVGN